jgi:hypothetical protein
MGFKLMTNFNNPFASRNVTEFWRRWHISLSTWLNDYLFNPLVIAKRELGKRGVVYALMITFLISGFWHGAGWTFIIYGALHGIALAFEFLTKKSRKKFSKKVPAGLYNSLSAILTFLYVSFSFIFFRAGTFRNVSAIFYKLFHVSQYGPLSSVIKSMQNGPGRTILNFGIVFFGIIILFLGDYLISSGRMEKLGSQAWLRPLKPALYAVAVILFLSTALFTDVSRFIYFQF